VPELPPLQQTNTLASGNYADISAMRRRLELTAHAQPASSMRDKKVSKALTSAKLPNKGVNVDAENELDLVRSAGEEEVHVDEGPAADPSNLRLNHASHVVIF